MIYAILLIISIVVLGCIAICCVIHFREVRRTKKYYEGEKDERIKMTEFYDILVRWIMLYQKKQILSDWFVKYGYKRVAVYGMREIGQMFYNELLREGVNVVCAIDRNARGMNLEYDVFKPTDDFPKADVIVVTAPHYFEQIKNDLQELTDADVVSIEDVIFEL